MAQSKPKVPKSSQKLNIWSKYSPKGPRSPNLVPQNYPKAPPKIKIVFQMCPRSPKSLKVQAPPSSQTFGSSGPTCRLLGSFWKLGQMLLLSFGQLLVNFWKVDCNLSVTFGDLAECYFWALGNFCLTLGSWWPPSKSFPKVTDTPKVISQKLPKTSNSSSKS